MAKLPKGYFKMGPKKRSQYWAKKRQAKADLLNPSKPLAGNNLYNVAKAQVDLSLKPQVSALDSQARSSRIQGGALAANSDNYYKGLAQEAQAGIGRVQALRSQSAQNLGNVNAAAQSALDRTQAVADNAQAADTGVRGPGLSGGGDERVRAELAAARGRSSEIGQSEAAAGENLGANWEGFARQIAASTQLKGGEVHTRLLNRLANELSDIRTKKAVVLSSAGDNLLTNLVKLRQQAFENAATASTLGQKNLALQYQREADDADRALRDKTLTATVNQNQATNDLAGQRISQSDTNSRRTSQSTRRGQDLSHADRVAAIRAKRKREADALKKNPAKMPQSTIKARGNIENVRSIYDREWDHGKGKSLTEVAKSLREAGASNLEVNIGSALATRGYLTNSDVARLKAAYPGIQIPAGWTRHKGPVRVVSTR